MLFKIRACTWDARSLFIELSQVHERASPMASAHLCPGHVRVHGELRAFRHVDTEVAEGPEEGGARGGTDDRGQHDADRERGAVSD